MTIQATRCHLVILTTLSPLLLSILAANDSACTINLNSGLSAGGNNPPWLSPSGEFAFGFRSPFPPGEEELFLLSIWFKKVQEPTIVWSKNDLPVTEGSRIELTDAGELILYDSRRKVIWKAQTWDQRSTCAAMLDSGNFVLMNGDSGNYIWESFNVPTDTFLPGQRLKMGGNLTSRQSQTNYMDGRFQLRMQKDGNLVLYSIFLPTETEAGAYWSSQTDQAAAETELVFDEAGYIYLERGRQNIFNVTRRELGSRQEFYYFARIDFDGVFRHYTRPRRNNAADASKGSLAWSIVQRTPEDICTAITGGVGSGACGYNSYCVNVDGRPSCFCPEGYSPVDPVDLRRGCKPNFELPNCQENGWASNAELVEFKELKNTDWPLTDYEYQKGIQVDKESCKEYCLRDCFCAVAIYRGNDCWKKRFPLSNGRESIDSDRIALIKVPKNYVTRTCPKGKDRSTLVLIISAFLGSSVFLNLLLLTATSVAIFVMYRKKMLNLQSADATHGVRRYTYNELHQATGGFGEQLGRGSFGTVYKGVLPSIPRKYIAIKKLDKVKKEGEKEFTTEVRAIGRTHHKNLVTLLGYCDEGQHRLLVYEYMSNGSLSGILFGVSRPRWNQRAQIALGIARGLTYLHEECSTQIIHCDIKPQNILLDESLTPKISDFGLAKLLLTEQSRAAKTHIRGTAGYFAPEWFRKASITVKVDVYSFGVMLLEMICCMSCLEFALGNQEQALIDWVYDCYTARNLNVLVENDEEAKNDMQSVERLVMVAIWCIQEDPSLRPSIRRVTQMLEGVAEVSVPPRPSIFSSS